MEEVINWYGKTEVKFEIVKQLFNREMAVLVPSWVKDKNLKKKSTRMLKVHNINHFSFCLKALEYEKNKTPYNFYYSLARYHNGIPNQNLDFNKRKDSQENKDWKITNETEMKGYDFLIDIDSNNHSDVKWSHFSCKKIVRFFLKNECPFILKFSGKGFHIIIPYKYLPRLSKDSTDENTIYMFCSKIARRLYEEFSEMIDLSIYDSRRLCKLSYSIALFENKNYVCFPFNSLEEFENFKLEDYELNNFKIPLRNRGVYIFNYHGTIDKMIKELGVEI